jgi:hypothetical protein
MRANQLKSTPMSWWARLIYAFVGLNALAGAFVLILFPAQTGTLFFWPINPPINAALFGALYLGGAVAVLLATWRNEWEAARYLIPILVTAGILISLVTLLHADKFTPGLRLAYWLVVYIAAPLLAALIYAVQERRGASWQVLVPLRPLVRDIATVTGALVLLAGVLLIVWPEAALARWPWPSSPLVARIFAAWFTAFGAGLLWFRVEGDWRRLRYIPNLMIAAAVLDLLMVFIHRQQITGSAASVWLYSSHLILFALLGFLLHGLQRRYVIAAAGAAQEGALESAS